MEKVVQNMMTIWMESLQLNSQRDIQRAAEWNRLGETIDGNKSNKRIVIRSSAMHEVLCVALLVVWRNLPLYRYESVSFLLFNQHNSTTRMETLRENRITANCAHLTMIAPKIIFFSNAFLPLLFRLAQPGKCGKKEEDKIFQTIKFSFHRKINSPATKFEPFRISPPSFHEVVVVAAAVDVSCRSNSVVGDYDQ